MVAHQGEIRRSGSFLQNVRRANIKQERSLQPARRAEKPLGGGVLRPKRAPRYFMWVGSRGRRPDTERSRRLPFVRKQRCRASCHAARMNLGQAVAPTGIGRSDAPVRLHGRLMPHPVLCEEAKGAVDLSWMMIDVMHRYSPKEDSRVLATASPETAVAGGQGL